MTLEFRSPSSVQSKRKHRGQSAGINHTFALVCSISAMFPFSEINFEVSAQSDGFYYGALCEPSDFVLGPLPPSLPSPPSALPLLVSILCFHGTRIPLPPLEISSSSLKVPSLCTLHIPVQIPHMRVNAVLVFLNLVSFVKITSISNHFPENNMI